MNDLKMRHLTLKKLREQKGWSLEKASKIYGLSAHTVSDYEEYRVIPNIDDVSIILKMHGLLYYELVTAIYDDIARNYNKH